MILSIKYAKCSFKINIKQASVLNASTFAWRPTGTWNSILNSLQFSADKNMQVVRNRLHLNRRKREE